MARCGCGSAAACTCLITEGSNITVTGSGNVGSPYIISAQCSDFRNCLSEGEGIIYDPLTGVISSSISNDTGNLLSFGADDGLFVSPGCSTVVEPSATSGTAINAAIQSMPTGGTILLCPGTHTLNEAVVFDRSGIVIQGSGLGTSFLQFNPGVVPIAMHTNNTTQRRVVLRDFFIGTTSGAQGSGTAIDASFFSSSYITNLTVGSSTRYPNIGIDVNGIGSYYNHIADCAIAVGGASSKGIRYGNVSNMNVVSRGTIRVFAVSGSPIGIEIGGNSHSIHLNNVDIEGAAITGVSVLAGSHDVTLSSCYLENLTVGLAMAAGVESVRVFGGYIDCTTNVVDSGAVGYTQDNVWLSFSPGTSFDYQGVTRFDVNGLSLPSNEFRAEDHNQITWAYDIAQASASTAAVNGTMYLMKVRLEYAKTITSLGFGINVGATTPTAGQNWLAIYDMTGTRVGVTADISAITTTAGFRTANLTAPVALAAGYYWIAILLNAATPATLLRASGAAGPPFNAGLTAANYRFATNGTAQTTTPASITPASNLQSTAAFWSSAA